MQVMKQHLELDMEQETGYKSGKESVKAAVSCHPAHLTYEYQTTLPASRNLYAGQEASVRTRHGTTDWFQIGKGVH